MFVEHNTLLTELKERLVSDPYWTQKLSQLGTKPFVIHLAVFVEPYLGYVLAGRKTIESRFSVKRCAPYGQVSEGDVVLLKRSSGPIVGICTVSIAWYYQLDPTSWQDIRRDFTTALCAQDPEFWTARAAASFATLMRVQHVAPIAPLPFAKRDRRGWVVLSNNPGQLPLVGI